MELLRRHARNRLGFVCHLDVKDYSLENYDFFWQLQSTILTFNEMDGMLLVVGIIIIISGHEVFVQSCSSESLGCFILTKYLKSFDELRVD